MTRGNKRAHTARTASCAHTAAGACCCDTVQGARVNTIGSTARRRLVGAVTPLLLLAILAAVWAAHRATDEHEGAFDGPCSYHATTPTGPVAELKLTDHGAPVQVGYLVVEERDVSGSIINANRVQIGTSVASNETRTFSVPAIAGAASCRLLNWGE